MTWLTIAEAGKRFGLSRATLYRLISDKKVERAKKAGDARVYLNAEDLQRETAMRPVARRDAYVQPWQHAKVSPGEWALAFKTSQDQERRAVEQWRRLWQKGQAYFKTHIDQAHALDRAIHQASADMINVMDGDRETILRMLEKRPRKARRPSDS